MSAGGHAGSMRVILFALGANFGIAIAKFAGAFFSGSASLLAEAIHSSVDCANQLLLIVGAKKSQRPPDARHPLGYGRESFFWSFLVAIALFTVGGLYSLYEGVHKLLGHGDSELQHPALGLAILVFGILLEGFSFHACLLEVRAQNRHGSLLRWFRRSTASELLVIFAEDLAALLGLVFAACCLSLAWATGDLRWDSAGSVLVGGLLLVVASFLAVEVKGLLIGEASETDFRPELERLIRHEFPEGRLLRLIALQTGPGTVMLACKFHPGRSLASEALIEGMNRIESRMRAGFPEISWQFLEPDHSD